MQAKRCGLRPCAWTGCRRNPFLLSRRPPRQSILVHSGRQPMAVVLTFACLKGSRRPPRVLPSRTDAKAFPRRHPRACPTSSSSGLSRGSAPFRRIKSGITSNKINDLRDFWPILSTPPRTCGTMRASEQVHEQRAEDERACNDRRRADAAAHHGASRRAGRPGRACRRPVLPCPLSRALDIGARGSGRAGFCRRCDGHAPGGLRSRPAGSLRSG